jgi:hypothetical protein
MNFDLAAAGLDPKKLVTRGQLAALVRELTGIPLVESRIVPSWPQKLKIKSSTPKP